jgi:hypothetical protein
VSTFFENNLNALSSKEHAKNYTFRVHVPAVGVFQVMADDVDDDADKMLFRCQKILPKQQHCISLSLSLSLSRQ